MATVASKRTDLGRYAHCSPRLGFDEFRFMSDELCVTDEFFRQVKIGDKIRITGQVSSYAVESDELEVVIEEFAGAKEVE